MKHYIGYLPAAGYAGNEKPYSNSKNTAVACLAQIRRKFVDIHNAIGSCPLATEAIIRIADADGEAHPHHQRKTATIK